MDILLWLSVFSLCTRINGGPHIHPHIDLKKGKTEGQPGGSALLNMAKLRVFVYLSKKCTKNSQATITWQQLCICVIKDKRRKAINVIEKGYIKTKEWPYPWNEMLLSLQWLTQALFNLTQNLILANSLLLFNINFLTKISLNIVLTVVHMRKDLSKHWHPMWQYVWAINLCYFLPWVLAVRLESAWRRLCFFKLYWYF